MGTAQQPGLVPSLTPGNTAVEALDSKPEDLTFTLNSKQDTYLYFGSQNPF